MKLKHKTDQPKVILAKVSCVTHSAQCSTFTFQCLAENDIPALGLHQQQMPGAALVFGPDNSGSHTLLLCFCKAGAGRSWALASEICRIDQHVQPDKYSPAKHQGFLNSHLLLISHLI